MNTALQDDCNLASTIYQDGASSPTPMVDAQSKGEEVLPPSSPPLDNSLPEIPGWRFVSSPPGPRTSSRSSSVVICESYSGEDSVSTTLFDADDLPSPIMSSHHESEVSEWICETSDSSKKANSDSSSNSDSSDHEPQSSIPRASSVRVASKRGRGSVARRAMARPSGTCGRLSSMSSSRSRSNSASPHLYTQQKKLSGYKAKRGGGHMSSNSSVQIRSSQSPLLHVQELKSQKAKRGRICNSSRRSSSSSSRSYKRGRGFMRSTGERLSRGCPLTSQRAKRGRGRPRAGSGAPVFPPRLSQEQIIHENCLMELEARGIVVNHLKTPKKIGNENQTQSNTQLVGRSKTSRKADRSSNLGQPTVTKSTLEKNVSPRQKELLLMLRPCEILLNAEEILKYKCPESGCYLYSCANDNVSDLECDSVGSGSEQELSFDSDETVEFAPSVDTFVQSPLDIDSDSDSLLNTTTCVGKNYECTICDTFFNTLTAVTEHVTNLHLRTDINYKCNSCEESLDSITSLMCHIRKKHRYIKSVMEKQKLSSQLIALEQEMLLMQAEANTKIKLHPGKDKSFICSVCCKRFSSQHYLSRHLSRTIHNKMQVLADKILHSTDVATEIVNLNSSANSECQPFSDQSTEMCDPLEVAIDSDSKRYSNQDLITEQRKFKDNDVQNCNKESSNSNIITNQLSAKICTSQKTNILSHNSTERSKIYNVPGEVEETEFYHKSDLSLKQNCPLVASFTSGQPSKVDEIDFNDIFDTTEVITGDTFRPTNCVAVSKENVKTTKIVTKETCKPTEVITGDVEVTEVITGDTFRPTNCEAVAKENVKTAKIVTKETCKTTEVITGDVQVSEVVTGDTFRPTNCEAVSKENVKTNKIVTKETCKPTEVVTGDVEVTEVITGDTFRPTNCEAVAKENVKTARIVTKETCKTTEVITGDVEVTEIITGDTFKTTEAVDNAEVITGDTLRTSKMEESPNVNKVVTGEKTATVDDRTCESSEVIAEDTFRTTETQVTPIVTEIVTGIYSKAPEIIETFKTAEVITGDTFKTTEISEKVLGDNFKATEVTAEDISETTEVITAESHKTTEVISQDTCEDTEVIAGDTSGETAGVIIEENVKTTKVIVGDTSEATDVTRDTSVIIGDACETTEVITEEILNTTEGITQDACETTKPAETTRAVDICKTSEIENVVSCQTCPVDPGQMYESQNCSTLKEIVSELSTSSEHSSLNFDFESMIDEDFQNTKIENQVKLCDICGEVSSSKGNHHVCKSNALLKFAQVKTLHRLKCYYCGALYIDKKDWTNHVSLNHPGKAKNICYYCDQVFESEIDLNQHFNTNHPEGILLNVSEESMDSVDTLENDNSNSEKRNLLSPFASIKTEENSPKNICELNFTNYYPFKFKNHEFKSEIQNSELCDEIIKNKTVPVAKVTPKLSKQVKICNKSINKTKNRKTSKKVNVTKAIDELKKRGIFIAKCQVREENVPMGEETEIAKLSKTICEPRVEEPLQSVSNQEILDQLNLSFQENKSDDSNLNVADVKRLYPNSEMFYVNANNTSNFLNIPENLKGTNFLLVVDDFNLIFPDIEPTPQLQYQCQHCEWSFQNEFFLTRHLHATHDIKQERTKCDLNYFEVSKQKFLFKIPKRKIEFYKCGICKFSTLSKRDFCSHGSEHNVLNICGICNSKFNSLNDLSQHLLSEHSITLNIPNVVENSSVLLEPEDSSNVETTEELLNQNSVPPHVTELTEELSCGVLVEQQNSITVDEMSTEVVQTTDHLLLQNSIDVNSTTKSAEITDPDLINVDKTNVKVTTKSQIKLKNKMSNQNDVIKSSNGNKSPKKVKPKRNCLTCTFCGIRFKTKSLLDKHTSTSHKVTDTYHICQYCSFSTAMLYRLKHHLVLYHNNIMCDTPKNVDIFSCEKCRQNFNSKMLLTHHVENSHYFKCPFANCDYTCDTGVTLTNHKRDKHSVNKNRMCTVGAQNTSHQMKSSVMELRGKVARENIYDKTEEVTQEMDRQTDDLEMELEFPNISDNTSELNQPQTETVNEILSDEQVECEQGFDKMAELEKVTENVNFSSNNEDVNRDDDIKKVNQHINKDIVSENENLLSNDSESKLEDDNKVANKEVNQSQTEQLSTSEDETQSDSTEDYFSSKDDNFQEVNQTMQVKQGPENVSSQLHDSDMNCTGRKNCDTYDTDLNHGETTQEKYQDICDDKTTASVELKQLETVSKEIKLVPQLEYEKISDKVANPPAEVNQQSVSESDLSDSDCEASESEIVDVPQKENLTNKLPVSKIADQSQLEDEIEAKYENFCLTYTSATEDSETESSSYKPESDGEFIDKQNCGSEPQVEKSPRPGFTADVKTSLLHADNNENKSQQNPVTQLKCLHEEEIPVTLDQIQTANTDESGKNTDSTDSMPALETSNNEGAELDNSNMRKSPPVLELSISSAEISPAKMKWGDDDILEQLFSTQEKNQEKLTPPLHEKIALPVADKIQEKLELMLEELHSEDLPVDSKSVKPDEPKEFNSNSNPTDISSLKSKTKKVCQKVKQNAKVKTSLKKSKLLKEIKTIRSKCVRSQYLSTVKQFKRQSLKCSNCSAVFNYGYELKKHVINCKTEKLKLKKANKDSVKVKTVKRPLSPETCVNTRSKKLKSGNDKLKICPQKEKEKHKSGGLCNEKFTTVLLCNGKNRNVSCTICGTKLSSEYNLSRHIKTRHSIVSVEETIPEIDPPKLLPCKYCSESFVSSRLRSQHTKSKHQNGQGKQQKKVLPKQKKKFLPKQKEKMLLKRSKQLFSCMYCTKEYYSKCSVGRHIRSYHRDEKEKGSSKIFNTSSHLMCDFCNETFSNKEDILEHILNLHQISVDPSFVKTNESSGSLTSKEEIILNKPKFQNSDSETCEFLGCVDNNNPTINVTCKFCGQNFSSPSYMYHHVKMFHSEPEVMSAPDFEDKSDKNVQNHEDLKQNFSCNFCGNYFPYKKSIKDHIVLCHLNIENNSLTEDSNVVSKYRCVICHKQYACKKNLRSHIKSSHPGSYVQIDDLIQNVSVKVDILYPCKLCDKCYLVKGSLTKHVNSRHSTANQGKNHIKEKNTTQKDIKEKENLTFLPCDYCSKSYSNETKLKCHITKNHKDKILERKNVDKNIKQESGQFKCDHCNKSYVDKIKLLNHVKEDDCLNIKIKTCHICQFQCTVSNELQSHLLHFHNEPGPSSVQTDPIKFVCTFCNKNIKSKKGVKLHLKFEHKYFDTLYYCNVCNFYTSDNLAMKNHKLSHTLSVEENTQSDAIQNDKISQSKSDKLVIKTKSIKRQSSGQMTKNVKVKHVKCDQIKRSIKYDSYTCDLCQKVLKTKLSISSHFAGFHGMVEKNLTCPHCDFRHFQNYAMKVHIRSHFKLKSKLTRTKSVQSKKSKSLVKSETKFECKSCKKVFSDKQHLSTHKNRVHNERFKCHLCIHSYDERAFLDIHIQTAHDNKLPPKNSPTKHKCHKCGENFSKLSQLKFHLKKVHDMSNEVFICSCCSYSTNSQVSLQRHSKLCNVKMKNSKTKKKERKNPKLT